MADVISASFDIEGRIAEYHRNPDNADYDVLRIHIDSFEEALAIVETLTRSLAQPKKKTRKQESHESPPSPGQPVAGKEEGAPATAGGIPGNGAGATAAAPQGPSPKGTDAQPPAENRPADPVGERGSGEGGPPTPPAAPKKKAKKADCGGEDCTFDGRVEHHDPITCPRFQRKNA